jgi:acetyltransferase
MEFAIVIADDWQRRGVAGVLMERLIAYAKRSGLKRLEGVVLKNNTNMLKFTQALGFNTHSDPSDSEQVVVVRELA